MTMREIRQASMNSDELQMEVIEELYLMIIAHGGPPAAFDEAIEADRLLFKSLEYASLTDPLYEEWHEAEAGWRVAAYPYGIEVYDDGEAGYTYVGSSQEINVILTAKGGY